MKRKKFGKLPLNFYVRGAIGVGLLIAAALALILGWAEQEPARFASPLASGLVVLGIIAQELYKMKKYPAETMRAGIAASDERARAIRNKAAYAVFNATQIALGAAMFVLIFMSMHVAAMAVAGVALAQYIAFAWVTWYYNKKM